MTREADDRDRHVGARIRARRVIAGLSQDRLGKAIGVTFQQVQKYEKGTNRIGASRLEQVARLLDVPVAYFFEGAEPAPFALAEGAQASFEAPGGRGPPGDPDARRLAAALARIVDPEVRRRLADLAEALASGEAAREPPPVEGDAFDATNASVPRRSDD